VGLLGVPRLTSVVVMTLVTAVSKKRPSRASVIIATALGVPVMLIGLANSKNPVFKEAQSPAPSKSQQFKADLESRVLLSPDNFQTECGPAETATDGTRAALGSTVLTYKQGHLQVLYLLGHDKPLFMYTSDPSSPSVHLKEIPADEVAAMLNCDPQRVRTGAK
jgi:hypothetical protein